jgi:uncharacterized Zn ribbon protein
MERKKCLECGEEFVGRSDKKFCSDSCRNTYNNKLNSDENNIVRNTNNILRKNRRILKSIIPNGKVKTISKNRLLAEGYNTKHLTDFLKTKAGKVYFFCYEYGYTQLDENKVTVVKKDF